MTKQPQKDTVKKIRELYKERRSKVNEILTIKKAYRELQYKYEVAVKRLETIASGLHYSSEVTATWTNDTKLQVVASRGLEILSKMPHTEVDTY